MFYVIHLIKPICQARQHYKQGRTQPFQALPIRRPGFHRSEVQRRHKNEQQNKSKQLQNYAQKIRRVNLTLKERGSRRYQFF